MGQSSGSGSSSENDSDGEVGGAGGGGLAAGLYTHTNTIVELFSNTVRKALEYSHEQFGKHWLREMQKQHPCYMYICDCLAPDPNT